MESKFYFVALGAFVKNLTETKIKAINFAVEKMKEHQSSWMDDWDDIENIRKNDLEIGTEIVNSVCGRKLSGNEFGAVIEMCKEYISIKEHEDWERKWEEKQEAKRVAEEMETTMESDSE